MSGVQKFTDEEALRLGRAMGLRATSEVGDWTLEELSASLSAAAPIALEPIWCTVASGYIIDARDPGADQRLGMWDVAWGLANLNRWGGFASEAFSVAQHSLSMAAAATSPLEMLACLWHDSEECFWRDLVPNMKRAEGMAAYRAGALACRESLARRFAPALVGYDWAQIKPLDVRSMQTEHVTFFRTRPDDPNHQHFWGTPCKPLPLLRVGTPEDFARMFVRVHNQAIGALQ